jgi:hypothetical protein
VVKKSYFLGGTFFGSKKRIKKDCSKMTFLRGKPKAGFSLKKYIAEKALLIYVNRRA